MKRFTLSDRSLFVKIFISFLTVILLLSLVQLLVFTFAKTSLHNEIIASNRNALQDASERYSTHLSRLQALLYNLNKNKQVALFGRQLAPGTEPDYLPLRQVTETIRQDAYNPLFYLQALLVHYDAPGLAVDQEGSSNAVDMFERSYASRPYPYAFWKAQLASKETFRLFPAADFAPSSEVPGGLTLLPLVYRQPGSGYQVVALLHAAKAQKALFGEAQDRLFMMLDAQGTLLYRSDARFSPQELPNFSGSSDVVRKQDWYYFMEKNENSGITFISAVPLASMASGLRRLYWIEAGALLLSLALGLAASYVFSRRIHRPVQHLLSALSGRDAEPLQTGIREFGLIDRSIRALLDEREDIRDSMRKQRSALTHYGYMSRLKSIDDDINDWSDFLSTDQSYTVVLYELKLRTGALAALQLLPDRIVRAIREYIGLVTEKHFSGSHTFQMEKNQILSVIKGKHTEGLPEMLEEMKQTFDRDTSYCLVTAAISARFEHASQFNHAYLQVVAIAGQAPLREETRIVPESRALPPAAFDAAAEQELTAALMAGREEDACRIIERLMDDMARCEAGVTQFAQTAEQIAAKLRGMLDLLKIEARHAWRLKPILLQLPDCATTAEYIDALHRLIAATLGLMAEKQSEDHGDPVVERALELIETQYADDLSLDYLADQLKMSSTYLSAYIKEKTGTNFSEHLNGTRMRRAQLLLTETPLNINEISRQVGYQNITSFNRMFKKWTGLTPGEYRRLHKPSDTAVSS